MGLDDQCPFSNMTQEKYINVVLSNMCMIEDQEGRILVQMRTKSDWPGLTFPGGHVEANETLVQSVIREIKEETDLTIIHPKLMGVMEWPFENHTRYLAFIYKATEFSGTCKDSSEGHLFWIRKEDLHQYPLSQDMDKIFRIANQD